MGYRLYARIPNVDYKHKTLELGKQYDPNAWYDFNAKWFGAFNDAGLVGTNHLLEFYYDFLDANSLATEYPLYNVDLLKEMIDHAVENNYDMYFVSW